MITIYTNDNSIHSKRLVNAVAATTHNYRVENDMDVLFTWFCEPAAQGILLFHAVSTQDLARLQEGFKNEWNFHLMLIIPSGDKAIERYAQRLYPRFILKEDDNFEILTAIISKIHQNRVAQ